MFYILCVDRQHTHRRIKRLPSQTSSPGSSHPGGSATAQAAGDSLGELALRPAKDPLSPAPARRLLAFVGAHSAPRRGGRCAGLVVCSLLLGLEGLCKWARGSLFQGSLMGRARDPEPVPGGLLCPPSGNPCSPPRDSLLTAVTPVDSIRGLPGHTTSASQCGPGLGLGWPAFPVRLPV